MTGSAAPWLLAALLPLAVHAGTPTAPGEPGGAADAVAPGDPGDPARGRAIVVSRQTGLCLLCHAGPFAEEPFQGTLAPSLHGVGSRLSAAQLRQRLVDSRTLNPATLMPAYGVADGGGERVAVAWRGRPPLTAQQIEDVVALLAGLRE